MQWFPTSTDRDCAAQHLINESLRHERLERESRLVSYRETTPLGEPVPKSTGMADYRAAQLKKQTDSILDIINVDEDFIPGL